MSHTKELFQTIGDRIGAHADVRKVYGDPITMEGRTIIPVASVRFGFGAGAEEKKSQDSEAGEAGTGGGGGGMQATPAGVLELTANSTRFIRFHAWEPLLIASVVGFGVGLLVGRRR